MTPNGAPAVVAGAYLYTLWRGTEVNPNAKGWYLRTKDIGPPIIIPPINGGGNNSGGGSSNTGGESPVQPNVLYNPLVPIAEAYPQTLLNMMELDTYRQRRGGYAADLSLRGEDNSGDSYDSSNPPEGQTLMWARIKAGKGENSGTNSSMGIQQEYESWTLRSGADGVIFDDGDQSLSIGANVIHARNKTDIKSYHGDGSIDTFAWGIGTNLTWRGFNGMYVDVQTQTMWHSSDLNSRQLGLLVEENTGLGHAGSVEVGRQVDMGDGFSITPQAQLSYYWVDFQNFRDKHNVRVGLKDNDRMVARLGVSADKQIAWQSALGDTRHVQLYGILNLYYNLKEGTGVDVAGVYFEHEKERTWGGIGLGGTYSWDNDRYNIMGEINARSGFEEMSDNYDLSGVLRARMKW